MRRILALFLILSSAAFAHAEDDAPYDIAEQTYQPATTMAPTTAPAAPAMNVYAGQPVYAPQPAYTQGQAAPIPAARTPQPADYGQSVMTIYAR